MMKRLLFLILFVTVSTLSAFAQYHPGMRNRYWGEQFYYIDPVNPYGPPGEIVTVRGGWGNRYYMNGWQLDGEYLEYLMAGNALSAEAMRRARINATWSWVTVTAGASCLGYALVSLPFIFDENAPWSQNATWVTGGIGVLLVAATIPLIRGARRHSEQAVTIYNRGLDFSSGTPRPRPYVTLARSGVGLALKF